MKKGLLIALVVVVLGTVLGGCGKSNIIKPAIIKPAIIKPAKKEVGIIKPAFELGIIKPA
jgi:phosphate/sulfate permease